MFESINEEVLQVTRVVHGTVVLVEQTATPTKPSLEQKFSELGQHLRDKDEKRRTAEQEKEEENIPTVYPKPKVGDALRWMVHGEAVTFLIFQIDEKSNKADLINPKTQRHAHIKLSDLTKCHTATKHIRAFSYKTLGLNPDTLTPEQGAEFINIYTPDIDEKKKKFTK
jgi:hypothetical protein